VDGEIPREQLDRWVQLLSTDHEAQARFARYRLIGTQLASEETLSVDASGIARQVSAALRDEPTVLAPRRAVPFSLPKVAFGTALAAGVALLAVGLAPKIVGLSEPQALDNTPSFAFAPRLSAPAEGITLVAAGNAGKTDRSPSQPTQRWKVLSPDMQRKISRYLVEHNELAGHIAAQRPSSHLGYISTHEARH